MFQRINTIFVNPFEQKAYVEFLNSAAWVALESWRDTYVCISWDPVIGWTRSIQIKAERKLYIVCSGP